MGAIYGDRECITQAICACIRCGRRSRYGIGMDKENIRQLATIYRVSSK